MIEALQRRKDVAEWRSRVDVDRALSWNALVALRAAISQENAGECYRV